MSQPESLWVLGTVEFMDHLSAPFEETQDLAKALSDTDFNVFYDEQENDYVLVRERDEE